MAEAAHAEVEYHLVENNPLELAEFSKALVDLEIADARYVAFKSRAHLSNQAAKHWVRETGIPCWIHPQQGPLTKDGYKSFACINPACSVRRLINPKTGDVQLPEDPGVCSCTDATYCSDAFNRLIGEQLEKEVWARDYSAYLAVKVAAAAKTKAPRAQSAVASKQSSAPPPKQQLPAIASTPLQQRSANVVDASTSMTPRPLGVAVATAITPTAVDIQQPRLLSDDESPRPRVVSVGTFMTPRAAVVERPRLSSDGDDGVPAVVVEQLRLSDGNDEPSLVLFSDDDDLANDSGNEDGDGDVFDGEPELSISRLIT